ncbi:MAG TPA: fibronectin type III domain-containing protein [Gallionella sp.]|nr:fibronectin type III domain-containing protein [Gallionella sp.]
MAMFAMLALSLAGIANADVPGRALPGGSVPNPGTQQQELTNITFPAQWNVFEFVVTCGACHAGTVDQHTAHFGNWAGGNMASAMRDPVFRANQVGVNSVVKAVTGQDGAGNVCMRCHSPNGWLSGRFDPVLGGAADGSTTMNSILLSTDGEGVMCETCHRAAGSVTYKRPDVLNNASTGVLDKVWSLLAGMFDWEHQGHTPSDQAGDPTIAAGLPYGDTSLQFIDGMTYIGKYSGMTDVYFSDVPLGGSYTGQIYAVYPDWWAASGNPMNPVPAGMPAQNSAGQYLAYAADGTLPPALEVPVSTPINAVTGVSDYYAQAFSIEHPTVGGAGRRTSATDTLNNLLPVLPSGSGGSASPNNFIRTSEFCGSCHDLTVPVLNHGMPEQRTYTEWKFSDFSKATNVGYDPIKRQVWNGQQRCQDCHMPALKHEYTDLDSGSYNADPFLVGGFPYGKNRAAQGGTSFHKLAGANRDLPQMMKVLYPEVDLEIIGVPTGKDPRPFPGMLSDRGPMWDRTKNNTEISMRDALDLNIIQAPTEVAGQPGVYEMKVKVLNQSGHRIPTGYPDGRRLWLSVAVKDSTGATVYQSGVYDAAQATLSTSATEAFKRAQSNVIDATVAGNNAVMVYERVTGTCTDTNGAAIFPDPTAAVPAACAPSSALTNNFILFDNRIPPKGFTYADYRQAGVKFWNYNATTIVPYEEGGAVAQRYPDGQNFDVVTYRFMAPAGIVLTASAEAYWQTHTREFMEHLRDQDNSIVRPQGPPSILDPNYPANPNYLSNSVNGKPLASITDPFKNAPLNDNWGGVAYASWLETGKGAPFLVDRDDTTVAAVPAATTVTARALNAADPDYIDPVTLAPDVFAAKIEWTPVANAEGYTIWIRYGKSDATADWDRLTVVDKNTTSFTEHVLGDSSPASPGKTYGFKVVPFNGKGDAPDSNVYVHTVASSLPAAPTFLTASTAAPDSTATGIKLTWQDNATNEASFDVWRYSAIVNGVGSGVLTILNAPTQTGGPTGGAPTTGLNTWVDNSPSLVPGTCYYYQVRSATAIPDVSTWTTPLVMGCTAGAGPTVGLAATVTGGYRVDLNWTTNVTGVASYQVLRDGVLLNTVTTTSYADTTVLPGNTYSYTVNALDAANVVLATGTATATTTPAPLAPSNVQALVTGVGQVAITWVDNATNESGFVVERAPVINGVIGGYTPVTPQNGFAPPAIGSGTTQQFIDTTVAPNGVYVYRVMAIHLVNGNSLYAMSNQVATGVAPPTINSVTLAVASGPFATNSSGPSNITIAWTDNAAAEGGYEIQRCIGANCGATSVDWTALGGILPANSLQAIDNTLVATNVSQTVSYRVRAVLTGTTPSAWAYSTATTVPPLPGQPVISSVISSVTPAIDATNGQPSVTVTWSNVAGETGYVIERSTNGVNWTQVATPALDATSFVDTSATGLAVGNTYQYRVTAVAYSGWNSSATSSVTLLAPPAVQSVTQAVAAGPFATNGNGGTPNITVIWSDNSASEDGYEVQRCIGASCAADSVSWTALGGVLPANSTQTLDNTLAAPVANQSVSYRVRAVKTGTVPSVWAYSTTATVAPAPGKPAIASAIVSFDPNNGQPSVALTWTNVADETGYVVERSTDGVAWTLAATAAADATGLVDVGVTVGNTYQYRATAVGFSGWNSSTASSIVVLAPPAVQSVTQAVATGPFATNGTGTSSITLVWADNSASEDGYEVQRCIGTSCAPTSASWTALSGVQAANSTQVVDNTVTATSASQNVSYRVRAVKAGATPSVWAYSTALTVPPLPGKPAISSVVASTDPTLALPQVTVTWSNVTDEIGYVVERSTNGVNWTQVATPALDATSFVDTPATGLAGGATYQYRVTAVGNGSWNSSATSSITLAAPTAAPTISSVAPPTQCLFLFCGPVAKQLKVTFSVPTGATGWLLERSVAGANAWAQITSGTGSGNNKTFTDTGLTSGTSYSYRLRTYNNGGFSGWSALKTATAR